MGTLVSWTTDGSDVGDGFTANSRVAGKSKEKAAQEKPEKAVLEVVLVVVVDIELGFSGSSRTT